MSPEQARGGKIDFRTDQFSFGLMLYEMATGQHPFRRDSHPQTMAAIIADEPRPISEVNPKVPTMLRWIIERCLAKDPNDRYASSANLHKDLAMLQGRYAEITSDDNRPVVVAPPSSQRRTLTIGAAIVAAVVIAAFAVVASFQSARHRRQLSGHAHVVDRRQGARVCLQRRWCAAAIYAQSLVGVATTADEREVRLLRSVLVAGQRAPVLPFASPRVGRPLLHQRRWRSAAADSRTRHARGDLERCAHAGVLPRGIRSKR